MFGFDQRVGPDFGEDAPSYDFPAAPAWYRDTKLGFFVHWGLYSVPAWAYVGDGSHIPIEQAYAYHKYAEWYGNTSRIPGSPSWQRQQDEYGVGTSYEDLADVWDPAAFDATSFVDALAKAGARYVVPTTKHHDGFCLWGSDTTGFNAVRRGPGRDLISEFHEATRAADLKFGVYYSGALDWHVSDFPPMESMRDVFGYRRNDERFARYAAAQLRELIERFQPDILWNDIDWPDSGKTKDDFALAAIFSDYFAEIPEGVVNDRWGIPYKGFLTREYTHVADVVEHPWESTRGLGASFGYNQAETAADSMSGTDLIRHLVDVVSKNGNLLINIGPRADGSIPEVQANTMEELGTWLAAHGEGIYNTRPWHRATERSGVPQRYTTADDALYIHVLEPASGYLELPEEVSEDATIQWLASGESATADGRRCEIPQALGSQPVVTAKVQN